MRTRPPNRNAVVKFAWIPMLTIRWSIGNAYVSNWTKGIREVDLRCLANIVHSDRLPAKVTYPDGTEQDFISAVCHTWEDVVDFARLR
jgi:hypothetical protein